MRTRIVVGSRRSQLALIQSGMVVTRLRELNPSLEVEIRKIVTAGDRDTQTSLERIGTNVFVKELEEALLEGSIDLAVHSLKDMPTDVPTGLGLVAVTERIDPRDVLVARAKLNELPAGSRIGTDSLRRSVQLASLRHDLKTCGIRGNIDTRLKKVASGEVDGIILAAAALKRLGWGDKITEYLPFLPAVGQGALAIEARLDDKEIAELVAPLNHRPTWQSVLAERAFLDALGGGCRAPIAALGTVENNILNLEGMVAGISSKRILHKTKTGVALTSAEVGRRLAQELVSQGASELIAEANTK